jgi:glutathione S-transferase
MYKVIGSLRTRAFRVVWMLEELGQGYEVEPVRPRSETARAYNPSGKVPILLVDGEPILDSVAIVQFLADRHHRFTAPAETIERARQDSWTQFSVDDLESPLWFNAKNTFVLPEDLRSQAAQTACKYDFDRALDHFAERLDTNEYVTGAEFCVPDLLIGHCLNWAENGAGWPIPDGPVRAYLNRIRTRPAFQRVTAARDKS